MDEHGALVVKDEKPAIVPSSIPETGRKGAAKHFATRPGGVSKTA